jgi:hypothetical protein
MNKITAGRPLVRACGLSSVRFVKHQLENMKMNPEGGL